MGEPATVYTFFDKGVPTVYTSAPEVYTVGKMSDTKVYTVPAPRWEVYTVHAPSREVYMVGTISITKVYTVPMAACGAGGMGTGCVPLVVENLPRGVVVPNEQVLRGMLANMQ